MKSLLIVEDEKAQLEALKLSLTKADYTILSANNGEEGLQVALDNHPDLILLDLMMPKMGGLEMVQRLRQNEWGKEVKVIILTNSSEMDSVQKAMGENVFEYFVKSDTPIAHLVEKVEELLG